jgi:ribosomal protein L28
VFTVINWLLPSHIEKGAGGIMVNMVTAVLALVSLALPVVTQECELYISVQQRCFPGLSLPGANISASDRLKKQVFFDVTNIQGSRRIVLPDNEEYSIRVSADGFSPETIKVRNLCQQLDPLLLFFLFPEDTTVCPPMVLPKRQLGDPNS